MTARAIDRTLPVVTLSTDAGPIYAAQMRGALLSAVPGLSVVDLDVHLPPFHIPTAALAVLAMARPFPPGSIHLVIVDPGVGGPRAPLAIATRDGSFLVGPDNGVLDPLGRALRRRSAIRLDPARVVPGRRVSPTFEGRDLFAPAAARLATGTPIHHLGRPVRPHPLRLPRPRRLAGRIQGEILLVDRFGNLITNVPGAWAPGEGITVEVRLGDATAVRPLPRVRTYSELRPEALGVLVSSFGYVEIAAREGSAAAHLGARTGDRIELGVGAIRPGHRK